MNTHFNVSDQELAAATGGGWGFLAKLFIKQGVKQGVKQGAKQGAKITAKSVAKKAGKYAVLGGVIGGAEHLMSKGQPEEVEA